MRYHFPIYTTAVQDAISQTKQVQAIRYAYSHLIRPDRGLAGTIALTSNNADHTQRFGTIW